MDPNPYASPKPAGDALEEQLALQSRPPQSLAQVAVAAAIAAFVTTIVVTLAALSPFPGIALGAVVVTAIGWLVLAEVSARRRERGRVAEAWAGSRTIARHVAAGILMLFASAISFFATCTSTLFGELAMEGGRNGPPEILILIAATLAAALTAVVIIILQKYR